MSDRIEAPEGVEFDTHVYLTSDDGIEAVFSAKGGKGIPATGVVQQIVTKAIEGMPTGLGNWRVMSRDEIADYKRRQEEDVADVGDEDEEEF